MSEHAPIYCGKPQGKGHESVACGEDYYGTTLQCWGCAQKDITVLRAENRSLRDEISTDDRLIAERDRLVAAIPQCPVHGPCIPYAIEWVEKAILMMQELKAENEALRKDAERYRYIRSRDSEGHLHAIICYRNSQSMTQCFLDGEQADAVIDGLMRETSND